MQGVRLVTGAVGGMGRACALEWARHGARLVLSDLDANALARLCGELRAVGTHVQPVAGDIAEPAVIGFLCSPAASFLTGIDVLVDGGSTYRMLGGLR